MAELTNSQRRLNKATYVPLTIRDASQSNQAMGPGAQTASGQAIRGQNAVPQTGRVLDKVSFMRSLRITASEFDHLAREFTEGTVKDGETADGGNAQTTEADLSD